MKVFKEESVEVELGNLCDIINETIKNADLKEEIKGIGFGVPGTSNMDEGIIINLPNLPKWNGFNLKKFVEDRTGLDVAVNNDANVAALGEAKFGSGSSYRDIVMITLGTGVGGGVVINGKLFDGNLHQGAELGHMVIKQGGELCGCGRRGCLEAYASATALIRETKKAMLEHPESLLTDIEKELGGIDARNAFMASKRGDLVGISLVNSYVMDLGEGLINYCNIFRPEAIILSGGVANEGDYLLDKIRNYLSINTYGLKGSPKVEVVPASLGYDSGKIGAACLVLFK